jgi:hypothetical protein
MSRVCDDCGVETKKFAQCSNGQRTWYRCVDNGECEIRTRKLAEQKEVQAQEKRDKEFKEKHGDLDRKDLIKVGVMYRDATNYYYHKASDTLFGQYFDEEEFFRRDGPITFYERGLIERALKR